MIGVPKELSVTQLRAVSDNAEIARAQIEAEIARNLNYGKTYDKFAGTTIYQKSLKSSNILVMGSSELMLDFLPQNPVNFFRKRVSDFDMYLQGEAGYLSLEHAIEMGSFDPVMKNRKVVLIISPQWFTKDGIIPTDFFPHFSPYHFDRFLKNSSVSTETKNKVANRVKELYLGGPIQGTEVKKSISFIKKAVPVSFFKTYIKTLGPLNSLVESKDAIMPYNESVSTFSTEPTMKAQEIDWQAEFAQAEVDGKALCTTNDFNIRDDFFNTLIKPSLESLKGSDMNESYHGSREYGDLKLFLQVCKETRITPMIISTPLNGKWYDYTGFRPSERQKHYENIRKIATDYNVKLTELTSHEYDPYFFCDPVHIGWKGWLHVNQSVYNFYKD
jgi:D-alanine transfer protein